MKTLKELSDQLKQFDDLPKDQKNAILALISSRSSLFFNGVRESSI